MSYLADHLTAARISRRGRYGWLYPEEIEHLHRPVKKDAHQPLCAHCGCAFIEHCAGWFVGGCRKCNCKNYDLF